MKMQLGQIIFLLYFCCSDLVAGDKWSMTVHDAVKQKFGEDAIIPCSFTTPHKDYNSITVIWRKTYWYKGPIIFRCLVKKNESENGQNCTESIGRYSIFGDPRSNNISLRIKNITFADTNQYFCRVELSKKGDSFEINTGTILSIHVPQTLESIYIQTLPSGEQLVTCDVKGKPPPAVTWISPVNISTSLVSVHSGCIRASSSIPAKKHNTSYTCQIHGEDGLQHLSIFYSHKGWLVTEPEPQMSIPFIISVILAGIFFFISITLAVLYKRGSSQPVERTQKVNFRNCMSIQKDEGIYANA